ncbi:MAG TPA: hypothetical protein VFL12_03090 [Thermoanaerobaculia bacterium]|nr:hypothetical protein [Thermoanaerobaculia bacterium]
MKSGFRILVSSAALLLASAAVGQPVRIGTLSNAGASDLTGPVTQVDLTHPATADGVLTTATVYWQEGAGPCTQAMKIKVFRLVDDDDLEFVDERGPFDVATGLVTVALSPPLAVAKGDLIGVSEIREDLCGGALLGSEASGFHSVSVEGDVTAPFSLCDPHASLWEESVLVQASGEAEVYAGTVPGAGSAHGASGGDFKTAVQLYNPGNSEIRGRLVFHPMGVSGSSTDPSIAYDLAPGTGAHFDDLVASAGASGLGSLDVLTQGSPPPLVVTRVFNDAGAAGTSGFSEPLVRPGDPTIPRGDGVALYDQVYFLGPTDTAAFRANFGIRSFRDGVKLAAAVVRPGGVGFLSIANHQYGPDFFVQLSPKDFTGIDLPAGAVILVQIVEGSGVVYMVTVDNVTNDTAIQIGDRRRS